MIDAKLIMRDRHQATEACRQTFAQLLFDNFGFLKRFRIFSFIASRVSSFPFLSKDMICSWRYLQWWEHLHYACENHHYQFNMSKHMILLKERIAFTNNNPISLKKKVTMNKLWRYIQNSLQILTIFANPQKENQKICSMQITHISCSLMFLGS